MALMDFIAKQFIDVIQWTEEGTGTLSWRFPMADMEIQNGATLTVRESQTALFVSEGQIADRFGPGQYRLGTRTLPLLTNLRHWDKLFESPFKSEVYFFSTRQQVDQRWGTAQPITLRDKDFGAVRLRAFGNHSYRVSDPALFHREVAGTREQCSVLDIEGQLRALVVQHIADAVAESGMAFLDLAANQNEFAQALATELTPAFAALGLGLDRLTLQSLSLPDELQARLDQRIGLGMAGDDLGRFMQYQAAQALPALAAGGDGGGASGGSGSGGGGTAGDAMGLGAGLAMGQVLAQTLQQGLAGGSAGAGAAGPGAVRAEDLLATLERLGELKAKGILTAAEFDAKKTQLLSRLV